jgi:hypothetical protein
MNGVHARIVSPPRNAQTEYDMNINGPCHVKIIFPPGTYLPAASRLEDSSKGLYLSKLASLPMCRWFDLTGPRRWRTVTSDAESKIPRMAKIRLPCQKPWVSQNASSMVVQENAPITAAARTVHCVSLVYLVIRVGNMLTAIVMNCNSLSFRALHDATALSKGCGFGGDAEASAAILIRGSMVLKW